MMQRITSIGEALARRNSTTQIATIAMAAIVVFAPGENAMAQTIYVDKQLSAASCTSYSPVTRTCGGGTATAYKTLAGATAAANPGQTVQIRGGTYAEALIPQRSGTATSYISYEPYNNEAVTISGSGLAPAIDLSNRSYVKIRFLTVSNVQRFLLAVNAHNNVLDGNTFLHAVDTGGSAKTGLFFEKSTYNKVINNVIQDTTQDNLSLVQSDRNLVENNSITSAAHTLFTVKCGNYNVIRGNYFHNERQKIGEIYDCDGVGVDHDIFVTNGTKYNVVEENEFDYTPSSGNASPYAGIQYAGQNGIIRFNRFHDTTGPALDLTLYSGEAQYNTSNRVYGNVFYRTDFAGVSIAPAGFSLSDNLFKNNIFYRSIFVRNDTRWTWYSELSGKPVNIMIGRQSGFKFECNAIFNQSVGELYLITYGQRDSNNGAQHNVAWWQTSFSSLFAANIESDPKFVDANALNFQLRPDSPMIDAGTYLTRTVGAGSGTTLRVQDAGYFCNGNGIQSETGDLIRLQSDARTAYIVGVDYAGNTLTLASALSWSDGQGVSIAYNGNGPDLGAFESGAVACVACDVNCDGSVNQFDVQAFIDLLRTPGGCSPCAGDANGDGSTNQFDIQAFITCTQ